MAKKLPKAEQNFPQLVHRNQLYQLTPAQWQEVNAIYQQEIDSVHKDKQVHQKLKEWGLLTD